MIWKLSNAVVVSGASPVLIDSYLSDAIEVDVDAVGRSGRLLGEIVLQHVDHELDALGAADGVHRTLVELETLRVHDDVDVRRVVQLAQLQRGELRVRRTAAREDVHLLDTASSQLGTESSRARILELNQQACDYYASLYQRSWAPDYLRDRLGSDLVDDAAAAGVVTAADGTMVEPSDGRLRATEPGGT